MSFISKKQLIPINANLPMVLSASFFKADCKLVGLSQLCPTKWLTEPTIMSLS